MVIDNKPNNIEEYMYKVQIFWTWRCYLANNTYETGFSSATTPGVVFITLHFFSFLSWFVLIDRNMSIQSCAFDCILHFFPCNLAHIGIQFNAVQLQPAYKNLDFKNLLG